MNFNDVLTFLSRKGGVNIKNSKLRWAWIIPQIFLTLLDIALFIFTIIKWGELQGVRIMYLILSLLLLGVIILGVMTIRKWIIQGKM